MSSQSSSLWTTVDVVVVAVVTTCCCCVVVSTVTVDTLAPAGTSDEDCVVEVVMDWEVYDLKCERGIRG